MTEQTPEGHEATSGATEATVESAPVAPGPGGDSATPWKAATAVLGILSLGLAGMLVAPKGQPAAVPAATVTVTAQGPAEPAAQQPSAAQSPAPQASQPDQADQDRFLLDLPRRQAEDPMAMGPVDAPVVLTEWADYRCPFCSVWAEDTLPQLKKYVDEGRLRIEFRDLAIFGDDSVNAAAGARAAGNQGKFWEFQDALYRALPNQGHPPVDEALCVKIAQQVGVADIARFKADYASEEVRSAIMAQSAEAQQLGIGSTPTFLVGTEVLSGAQPLDVFVQVIEAQLAKHG